MKHRGKSRQEKESRRHRPEGFTLLELLISLTLLVVDRGHRDGGDAARLPVGGGRRKKDGRPGEVQNGSFPHRCPDSVPAPSHLRRGGEAGRYYFRGDGKTLRFPTSYSIWSGRKGYVIVDYRIEADGSGREVLSASEQVPGIEGQANAPLLEANGISIDYFYKDPTEEIGAWLELLPEGPIIPEKIRFRLTRGQEQFTLVFPVRVRHGIIPLPGEGNL